MYPQTFTINMEKQKLISTQVKAARAFLQVNFPVLYSPVLVSIDKKSISSIRKSPQYTQWKLMNPGIDHESCLDIAIGELVRAPAYFARMFFTANFELQTIDLEGNPSNAYPKSILGELTSRLENLKRKQAWYEDFSKALQVICKAHADD
jgi:hypothetical protein